MAESGMDSRTAVANTGLPYVVPVDMFIRGFQIAVLVISLAVLFLCLKDPTGTDLWDWLVAAGCLAFGILLQFRSSGLSIDERGVHHVSLLFKKRHCPWGVLQSVHTGVQDTHSLEIEVGKAIAPLVGAVAPGEIPAGNPGWTPSTGSLGQIDPSKGPYLMIFVRNDGEKPFILNFKPYSVRGLQTLVHFIFVKAPAAQVDQATRDILQGIFPSIFFGKAKGHG